METINVLALKARNFLNDPDISRFQRFSLSEWPLTQGVALGYYISRLWRLTQIANGLFQRSDSTFV